MASVDAALFHQFREEGHHGLAVGLFGKNVACAGAFHDHHQDIPTLCAGGWEMALGLNRGIDKDGINVRNGAHLFGTEGKRWQGSGLGGR